jgi:hypothetical protein
MIEIIIVINVVGLALFGIARSIRKKMTSPKGGCAGCDSCAGGCSQVKQPHK